MHFWRIGESRDRLGLLGWRIHEVGAGWNKSTHHMSGKKKKRGRWAVSEPDQSNIPQNNKEMPEAEDGDPWIQDGTVLARCDSNRGRRPKIGNPCSVYSRAHWLPRKVSGAFSIPWEIAKRIRNQADVSQRPVHGCSGTR
jgi:hypothetical protein